MILQSVKVSNFKSFTKPQTFSIKNLKSGLYFVTGENNAEPELGANGAGKSALFEAISWGLFGKTSNNLRAGNIINWGAKGCSVEIDLGGEGIVLTRTQNPNSIKWNDELVTQEELEGKLGLGFESFLYSTFVSQFSSKFFDLSPSDKMAVFSDIMSETLQPWLDKSDLAKSKAQMSNTIMSELEKTISNMKGQLTSLEEMDYSKQSKEFEAQKKKAVQDLEKESLSIQADIKTMKTRLEETKKEIQKRELPFTGKIKRDWEGEISQLEKEKKETINKLQELQASVRSLERDLSRIENVEKGHSTCPTCLQKVNPAILKKEAGAIKKQIEKINSTLSPLMIHVEELLDQIKDLNKVRSEEAEKLNSLKYEIMKLNSQADGITMDIKRGEKQIERINSQIEEKKKSKNPYQEMEADRKLKIKITKGKIEETEKLYGESKRDFDAYAYWVKGFKEIRLLLTYEALKEFEVSINNNLSKFGMEGWNVKLDIDQENKSGTIRKGFAVLVESPDHSGHVPFEVWSGGEGQRLRLAGTLGLMDLIQSRRSTEFGIEIFDEPTAWLSEKGIDDLLQILYYRAKESDKKIFMIDHKNLRNFGGFAGTVNVVKNEDGSQIRME